MTSDGPLPRRFVVVPAAYLFLLRGERGEREVLLQLRQHTGFMDGHWAAAAAGHVERGESAVDAVHREALEEIGVTGVDLRFCTTMQRTARGAAINERVDFFFTAHAWSGEPVIREPAKCADLRWCGLADLPEPVVPHELAVLTALRAGSVPAYLTYGFDDESGRMI